MVARRKRGPQRAQRSGLERSFRDAQRVLSGYLDSGGKQMKDTIASLLKIFEMEGGGRARAKPRTAARGARSAAKRPAAAKARPRKTAARSVASRRGAATRRSKATASRGGRKKATARS